MDLALRAHQAHPQTMLLTKLQLRIASASDFPTSSFFVPSRHDGEFWNCSSLARAARIRSRLHHICMIQT